tara:strand:- start:469 stop:663 length:195 start_codon:yes stop_codon:yes gene_type:complete
MHNKVQRITSMNKKYEDNMKKVDYERLLRNANSALENSKTQWSKNYWGVVIAQLERRSKNPILN